MDFNEKKAKEVSNYLLKNDIKIYRQFLTSINDLDSKSLENLFNGNNNYNYSIKEHYHFDLLIAKFNNFKDLLFEWYEDEENYKYLKELWLKNISLESLIDKKDNEIEQCLENKDIYISKWPEDKKEIFLQNLRNTKNTIYKKIKKFFDSIPEKIKKILEIINSLSKNLKKKGIGDLSTNLLKYASLIVMAYINLPKTNYSCKDICNICIDFISNLPSKFSFKEGIQYLKNNFPKFKETLKYIYEAKSTKVLYVLNSVYNLGSSFYDVKSITKIMKSIKNKEYDKEINKIEEQFNADRKQIHEDLNKCDISEYDFILRYGIEKIEKTEIKLREIIIGLNQYIQEVENNKNSQISGIVGGILQLGIGIVGGIATSGASSFLYFATSGINALSVIIRGVNINKLKDMNKEIQSYKEKCDAIHKEIEKELLELKSLLTQGQEAAPCYF